MITLEEYFQGRDILYKDELTPTITANAKMLLLRANKLLEDLGFNDVRVVSGWRPETLNIASGGAKHSYHITAQAVDIWDPQRKLTNAILSQPVGFLREHDLWMEDNESTPTWLHLDSGTRPDREQWIFKVAG